MLVVLPMLVVGLDGVRSKTAGAVGMPAFDPTQRAIPAVVAAVKAARRGAPIPSPLIPPLPHLLHDEAPPVVDCWDLRHEPHHLERCILVNGTRGTIVLIGDSHAKEWQTPLSRVARKDGWRLIQLWHTGCWPTTYRAGGECATFIRWAVEQVRRLRPDVALFGGAFKYTTPKAIRGTAGNVAWLVAELTPYARHVALIGDPPALHFQPTSCLGSPGATMRTCTSKLSTAQIAVYMAAEHAARDAGAAFLNTIGWFCYDRECPEVVGHTATYREDDHMSHSYAKVLGYRFHFAFVHAIPK
jgi:hypothetical protein